LDLRDGDLGLVESGKRTELVSGKARGGKLGRSSLLEHEQLLGCMRGASCSCKSVQRGVQQEGPCQQLGHRGP